MPFSEPSACIFYKEIRPKQNRLDAEDEEMTNDGEKAITKVGWTEGLMDKWKDSRTAKWIFSRQPRLYKRVWPSVGPSVRQ